MTLELFKRAGLITPRLIAILATICVITPLNAAMDGLAWLLLVILFTMGRGLPGGTTLSYLLSWLPSRWMKDTKSEIVLISVLFLARGLCTVILYTLEGFAQASVRRGLQEYSTRAIMRGRWEDLRHGNVGRWVGAATEESTLFGLYFIGGVRAMYSSIMFLLLALMAVLVNPKLNLVMLAVALPAGGLLRFLYSRHSLISTRFAVERQRFAADVTERLNGLFQIKAFGDLAPHIEAALSSQDACTREETHLAYYFGAINAFIPALVPILLIAFSVYIAWQGQDVASQMHVLGSVGILGYRAVSQVSIVLSSIGMMTTYAGSVPTLLQVSSIPKDPERELLPEPLSAVEAAGVGYGVGSRWILESCSLDAHPGSVFLITGPSGCGKTTLANLIAGLYQPTNGHIYYVGDSGKRYDAQEFRARIGYVTQDVFLFRGSVRQNLDPRRSLADAVLWDCLERAGAADFVRERGGLDAEIAEAGRSLSGGQRRRIAIAAALAQNADALILDEVTNGLDKEAKRELVKTIEDLSRSILVIAISHEAGIFDPSRITTKAMHPL